MIAGSQGYRYVLSVADHFSRYVKFYPLKSKHTHGVIEALAQYVTDIGAPHCIVLDNGGEFTSPGLPAVLTATPHHALLHDTLSPPRERHH